MGAIGKTSFIANSFYRVVFYDPIKHFSMKKSKNKVGPLEWYRLVARCQACQEAG